MADTTTTSNALPKARRWILMTLLLLLGLPLLGFAAWTWISLNVSYSNGERVGYVQKISKKGWACKTWEGELSMISIPGSVPQTFAFTVRDEAVARNLLDAAGERVAITYDQHRFVPSDCFGETEYFVTAIRVVGQ